MKNKRTDFSQWIKYSALILLVVLIGAGCGLVIGTIMNVPTWSPDKLYGSQTTTLYDKDSQPFTTLHGAENRIQVPLSAIPDDLQKAFLAIEDKKFYDHHGIDVLSIARAVVIDTISRSKAQGASTITQQLARAAFLTPEKTWERKIKEAVIAIQIEKRYSKDEILCFYLNRIFFGNRAWGVQTAAQTYFDKNAEDLTLSESALLAGIVQRPNAYNPYANMDLAKQRQRTVLSAMVDSGFISQAEATRVANEPIKLAKNEDAAHRYGHFVDYVVDEADDILEEKGLFANPQDAIFRGGLKIYTTIDPRLQAYAEDIYANPSYFPPGKSSNGQIVQSATVILDHHTGQVSALVGGRNYSQKREFNRAVNAYRQPGSAFKPVVVYGPALEDGYTPDFIMEDAPVSYAVGGKTWSPRNYDNKYRGHITMRTAVQWSVNVYAVKLADQIGIKNGIKFAENLGITSLVKAGASNDYNLSTALGGITRGVSPLELTAAYGAFANDGILVSPYVISRIEDNAGNILYEHRTQYRKVMKKETAALMTSMLQTVVDSGTGAKAKISGYGCAGKTGTTQEDKDAWYAGYTPYYTCAVWMGYDKRETMKNIYGGSYPARIWKAVMTKALSGKPAKAFTVPDSLKQVPICQKSGKLASPACPEADIVMKYLSPGETVTETCDLHVLVDICPDSGKLATPNCPNPVPQGFLKNAPAGDPEAMPSGYCAFHAGKPAATKVLVCKDPRNKGGPHLANLPGQGESGGCPGEMVEEIEVANPKNLSRCQQPDHQIKKQKVD